MLSSVRKFAGSLYRNPSRWRKNWYSWSDPRNWYAILALAYQYKLSVSQLRQGLNIWQTLHQSKRYLCTLPRSGTNYINCVLASASDIEAGGTGNYAFYDNRWVHETQLVYPAVLNRYLFALSLPGAGKLHPNLYWESHFPLVPFPVVKTPDSMKVIFTVREITQQLLSWISHDGFDLRLITDDVVLTKYLERSVKYFNYWGEFISQPNLNKVAGQDYLFFSYENLMADPFNTLLPIVKFWGLEIGEASLQKGIELCSKEQMKLRIPVSEITSNRRVTLERNEGQVFNPEIRSKILQTLEKQLQHNFGYEY